MTLEYDSDADSNNGSYVPLDGFVDSSSVCMENRDTFLGCAGFSGSVVGFVSCGAADCADGVADGFMTFFLGFLDTDNGLNIMGLPVSFTSEAGFCSSGIEGCESRFGAGRPIPRPELSPSSEGSVSRLNPGAALVLKLIPGGFDWLEDGVDGAFAAAFFGAGRNELKPENKPLPPVFARFAGGPSGCVESSAEACGKLTTILPGFDRSTTFWNGFLAPGFAMGFWGFSDSEPEDSDSE